MKQFSLSVILFLLLFALKQNVFSWGSTGHKFINKKSVVHLPPTMQQFINQATLFESHSSDADIRRSNGDTAEAPKHFMDIDWYPNYHQLTRNLDTLLAQWGWTVVKDNGINPWATVWTLDSLTAQLQRGDWTTAYLTASDLGHYVGDAHQPLHNTKNYNGQYTGNNGIHSRYESTMLNTYQTYLVAVPDSVQYIYQPIDFIFEYIYHTNSLVDSVLHADDSAKAIAGGTSGTIYYQQLWNRTNGFTIDQIQRGTEALASLFYTAWVNAGLLPFPTSIINDNSIPFEVALLQNSPNPFNPTTSITFSVPQSMVTTLKVYNVLGREVATLLNNNFLSAGTYKLPFDATDFSSGLYFYRLEAKAENDVSVMKTRKMIFLK
ncbi:MAG: T9SS type A sorting domain-containing protein [Ignavibacteriales bacterium]|nr:T9SS type A sorting domain-containing protein [Ignavibacteriales bacterium]